MSLISRRARKRPELPLVPLIDVLVMLVLFAYVTMQARSAATLNITLPKVETAGKNNFKGLVTIAITKTGELSFNGNKVSETQLVGLLNEVKKVDRDTPVLLKADKDTPLEKVTSIWDMCRKAGLFKQSLQSR